MAQPVPPKRGGIHPTYGIFIGGGDLSGGDLDDEYKLTGLKHYKYSVQRRGAKVINSIEQALLKAIESKDFEKFNGKLETTKLSMENELDKESAVLQVWLVDANKIK